MNSVGPMKFFRSTDTTDTTDTTIWKPGFTTTKADFISKQNDYLTPCSRSTLLTIDTKVVETEK